MHIAEARLVVSATDVSGFLACQHLTTQELAKANGGPKPPRYPDPGVEVLQRRGHEHEANILEDFRTQGLTIAEPHQPSWDEGRNGGWARCAAETLEMMRSGADVIYQACLFDGQWLGRPDFLIKVDRPSDLGAWSYEVVDAKLSRLAKAGAVLQICFYSELLTAVQGTVPERMHLALGGMHAEDDLLESFRVADFGAYYRSVKHRFLNAIEEGPATYPEPCTHCDVCAWSPVCRKKWRADDHLSLVAGITRKQRAALEAREIPTLEALGEAPLPLDPPLQDVSRPAYAKVREQARLQLEGRRADEPLYEFLEDVEDDAGLGSLPAPSDLDLYFDIESDPHAFDDGLEYLLGWVDVEGVFTGLWALTPDEERTQFEAFMDEVIDRFERDPAMHVYHYAAYEQTAIKRLAARHGTREAEVDRLLRAKVFVDLYRTVRQSLRASVESYSIKKLEPLYRFDREVELRAASSALANFEVWLQLGSSEAGPDERARAQELLDEIEGYNKDDCVSTLQLRHWLEERREELIERLGRDLPRPEPGTDEASERAQEEEERVAALVDALTAGVPVDPDERDEDQEARWLLAQLLPWHRREKKSQWWDFFRFLDLDDDEMREDGSGIGGLTFDRVVDTVARSTIYRYRFPVQDFRVERKDTVRDPQTGASAGTVHAVDADAYTIDVKRGNNSEAPHPSSVFPFDNLPDKPRNERLWALAEDVIERGLDGTRYKAAVQMLLRRPPRAGQGEGEVLRGPDETNLEAARRIATQLDGTVLPIQGPPGSGKTYIGARMIVSLIRAGKRVGVTATSHKVIVNLLDDVCEAAEAEGVTIRGVQKANPERGCQHPFIECIDKNESVEERAASGEADLIAGTTWLWARDAMQDSIDVLVVDEAGQISLANVIAASGAADSVVLLGDPRQLEQPQKGVHPPGADAAALQHLVGDATLAPDRGLFLEETWRLHPDICAFTSELYYENRLTSRPELVRQELRNAGELSGTGLRFVPVEHEGRSSEAPEEVEAIRGIFDRLTDGSATWVDQHGDEHTVDLEQVLVVAPYNVQVNALRDALPDGARVGTVDKFQGQQAAVVLYSMAASSAQDAPRGMDFLFNANRLNVATSRARCVAVVVASPALVGPDCNSVRQMQLANGICRLGEMADR